MLTPQHRSVQQKQHNPNYLAAPPVQAPATSRNYQRDSIYGRPTSSVYSQPSPEAAVFAAHQLRNDFAHPDPLEISPPSSPDIASPREGPYPGDVSPIDETLDTSQPGQERQTRTGPRSNIPMMRRERRKNADAVMNSLRESKSRDRTTPPRPYGHDVLWDPRTGEPTTSAKGRPAQVHPQEFAHGLTNRAASASSSSAQSKPSPPNPASLRDRLRPTRQTSASPQSESAPRPGWRGASGRTAIVAPVRDNKNVPPLNIPPRSEKRLGRNVPVLSPVESNGSEAASSPLQIATQSTAQSEHDEPGTLVAGGTPSSRTPQPADAVSNSQSSSLPLAYPTPPLSEEPIRVNRPLAQGSTTTTSSPLPRLQIPSNDKAIRRKPARVSSGQYSEPSTSSEHAQHDLAPPPGFYHGFFNVDEDRVPLPTPPQHSTPTPAPKPTPEVSILDRGRPTVSGYGDSPKLAPTEAVRINLESPFHTTSPSTTATKSLVSGLHASTRVIPEGNHSTLSVVSVLSLEKSLPPAPPEASAKDRVTELNAQLEALGNRRININTAIRKLTEMMPTDNILASEAVVRKREGEKRKVEALRTELADVERQSYELGLKLHRAYKRLDRNAEYEPTTLWVRRVTG
ncbi:hypothetical protein EKO27_g5812 [Xylaria grammica]|uniref:Uncharacterized protein n=1 Tax=Xylaria grammica TaxID=363999 RepID=A0A439D4E7_9PEZI|nr:hypothetical protein EKO27_g5812 [Xylaria grammica]